MTDVQWTEEMPLSPQSEPTLGAPASFPLGGDHAKSRPLGGRAKRGFDVAAASLALLVLAPLMLMLVILIMMTMGRPVFFAHRRVGHNGTIFPCYKLRTMVADPDVVLAAHLARDPTAAAEWREKRKLTRDPRITLFGRVLRKSSLDELPQLFNVLKGEMSCVGPRPVVSDELERYGPLAATYLRARPGITGLWQTRGRNSVDYSSRIAFDCQYVQQWSVWLDLVILARTMFVVLKFDETA